MEATDQELVNQYRRGHVEALDVLIERYRRLLFGFILSRTSGTGDADEVFQETWFRVIRKIGSYRERNFRGWLVRIARNIIIDRARRRKPDVSLDAEPTGGRTLADVIPGNDPGPRRRIEANDLGKAIAAAVAGLPDEQQEVFLMRVEADLSFKEIAKAQRVSINTALARMQYALAKLRPLLKSEYEGLSEKRM
jgi:RNA polymerase sigma-70 factor (ECF subfamily)